MLRNKQNEPLSGEGEEYGKNNQKHATTIEKARDNERRQKSQPE